MKIAIVIASRNRPDRIEALASYLGRNVGLEADWIAVEAGTDPERLTQYTTIHYTDEDFSGLCTAHAVGVEHARKLSREGAHFDYYWILTHDLEFPEGFDPLRGLVETMERSPRLAIVAPTRDPASQPRGTPWSERRPGGGHREAIPGEASGFLLRARALEECGFLNPTFRYGEGAMIEYAHELRRHGWTLAYSDDVSYRHAGETTYGQPGTKTISASERERRGKRFAYLYFLRVFGPRWAEEFQQQESLPAPPLGTYADYRRGWADGYGSRELADLHADCAGKPLPTAPRAPEAAEATTAIAANAPAPALPRSAALSPEPSPEPSLEGDEPLVPWPLVTEAPHRLLAWPRYDDDSDLEALLRLWSDALIDEPARCLCLRLDPSCDPSLEEATALLTEVYRRVVGEGRSMEVLFVDEEMDAHALRRLGRAVDGVLAIPGCLDLDRARFHERTGAARLEDLHALLLMARTG